VRVNGSVGLPHSPRARKAHPCGLERAGTYRGVRKIAARFRVSPDTVQRISRPFGDASAAAGQCHGEGGAPRPASRTSQTALRILWGSNRSERFQ
jgi:hypothetical protein